MIDKALEWCAIGFYFIAAISCFFVGLLVLNCLWKAANKSIWKTLCGFAFIYLPMLCPVFSGMFFVALFKLLGR
ncbi:hypothetical protein [Succinatimonas hippei]|uniref:hypothetical protein n=1 Tax=Succinatimonas hippei TaxID=626938 RepID=UPI0024904E5D|nr:hypothetical protein [Succinatimonas hippei]